MCTPSCQAWQQGLSPTERSHSTVPMALNSLCTQADSELVPIMILWPIHFCLLSAVLGYSCEHPTRLGNILIITDNNLHSIKHDYRVGDAAQLAQHAPSSGFAPQHQIKGKGGSEVKAVGRVSPAWAVWEPVWEPVSVLSLESSVKNGSA